MIMQRLQINMKFQQPIHFYIHSKQLDFMLHELSSCEVYIFFLILKIKFNGSYILTIVVAQKACRICKQFIQQLQLSNFTSQMVNFFAKMKDFFKEEQTKRKKIFQEQKQQISKLIIEKTKSRQKNDFKITKKQAKKQKSQRKKIDKQLKIKLKAPKAPNSAYFLFFLEYKQKIKEDFPQYTMVQMAKMAGKLWKQLQNHEKQIYFLKHQEQKKNYEQAMNEFKLKKKKWQEEQAQKKKWQQVLKKNATKIQQQTDQALQNEENRQDKERVQIQEQIQEQKQQSREETQQKEDICQQPQNQQIKQAKSPIAKLVQLSFSGSSEEWGQVFQGKEQTRKEINRLYGQFNSPKLLCNQIIHPKQLSALEIIQKLRLQSKHLAFQTKKRTAETIQKVDSPATAVSYTNDSQKPNKIITQDEKLISEDENSIRQDSISI